jgi:hypothetical protein
MNGYSKPEVAILGDATGLIQGSKPGRGDQADFLHLIQVDECTED